MRLADFIEQNIGAILDNWDAFAVSVLPDGTESPPAALRDHAEEMLRVIVADLRQPQSRAQQDAKGKGNAPRETAPTPAERHALQRARADVNVQQLVGEYRALRASVLRLYADSNPAGRNVIIDIGRFNEAIDQALAESVQAFAIEVEHWRNVFLGMLGHDLRGPLNAILLSAKLIAKIASGQPVSEASARLIRGGERMRELLNDLLDYSRGSLSLGIRVKPEECDLGTVCREEVELRCNSAPDCVIFFSTEGSTAGHWDRSRLKQLLGNLISNAVQYGTPGAPVNVRLVGRSQNVRLTVENQGEELSRANIEAFFKPLRRVVEHPENAAHASLGLGLFIVREIALAHGGTIDAHSESGKTTFTVVLPRKGIRTADSP